MARKIAILYLALASPLVLLSFCLHGVFAEYLFAVLAMAYPVALIAMAVARHGELGPLAVPLGLLLLILEGCALAMLLLRGRVMDAPWIGGLPAAAAVQLYGLWLLPLVLVALAYALSFDAFEMSAQDLERFESATRNDGDEH